jgi:hypothetical protein
MLAVRLLLAGRPVPQLQIESRFHGPPHSANGGYACGLVAAQTDVPVRVSLRVPPPLDHPMVAERTDEGGVRVHDGDTLVAEATPATPVPQAPPAVVTVAGARMASERFTGFHDHPFPTCWVCGPRRPGGDGLRIFTGPVDGAGARAGLVAAVWTPHADVDDGDGNVAAEHVWAALDCPTYFGTVRDEPALLASLGADFARPVRVGEPHVVLGWATDAPDGRKRHGASAVLDASGDVLASASARWVTLSQEALADLLEPR